LAGNEFKTHPNETFIVDPHAMSEEELQAHPYTTVHMRMLSDTTITVASAFHIADGYCVYKLGLNDVIVISRLDRLKDLYHYDTMHAMVLASRCSQCKTNMAPELLRPCTKCQQGVVYCGNQCELRNREAHGPVCGIYRNPRLLLQSYRAVQSDVLCVLDKHGASSAARELIERLLTRAQVALVPCSELQLLNFVAFPNECDKSLGEWCIPYPKCRHCTFTPGVFTSKTKDLIIALSAVRALCFVPQQVDSFEKLLQQQATSSTRLPLSDFKDDDELEKSKKGRKKQAQRPTAVCRKRPELFEPRVDRKVRAWTQPDRAMLKKSPIADDVPPGVIGPPGLLKCHRHGTWQAPFTIQCNMVAQERGFVTFEHVPGMPIAKMLWTIG
jgi:hypothetical protein